LQPLTDRNFWNIAQERLSHEDWIWLIRWGAANDHIGEQ